MTRGQLPKAYLRMDPNIDHTHPDNLDGFVRLLCAANRQPHRGWFRDRRTLDQVLGKRLVDKFYARGDVVDTDGGVFVPGWEEWQEGDWTVADRMRRIRSKDSTPVTRPSLDRNDVTGNDPAITVTRPSHDRIAPSEASRRLGVKASTNRFPPTLSSGANGTGTPSGNGKTMMPSVAAVLAQAPETFHDAESKREHEAWASFGAEWSAVRLALRSKGLRLPPAGEVDELGSQRALLFELLDAWPDSVVRWIRESKGRTMRDVVADVLEAYHKARDEAAEDADARESDWQDAKARESIEARARVRQLAEGRTEALDELGF